MELLGPNEKPKNPTIIAVFVLAVLEKRWFPSSVFPFGGFLKQQITAPPTVSAFGGRWTQLQNADGMARASDRGAARARDDEGGFCSTKGVEVNKSMWGTRAATKIKER